jgi:O-acetyl-ADP-ribose deacetylase (regulator of RNase III)
VIHYVTGDASMPRLRPALIAHVCNDLGAWGAGFSGALSKRWPVAEVAYRSRRRLGLDAYQLGHVQFVTLRLDLHVANMIAQRGIRRAGDAGPPIRYAALHTTLQIAADHAHAFDQSVHMPRIGCGLAGGEWAVVEPIIEAHFVAKGIPVYVYDLPSER